MCLLDILFNYFFIFPTRTVLLLGTDMTMPGLGLGVAGAALGSLLAFVCAALPLTYYAIFRSPILAWKQDVERFTWHWHYIGNAVKIGAPMALQYLLMNGAQLVSTMIVAPWGISPSPLIRLPLRQKASAICRAMASARQPRHWSGRVWGQAGPTFTAALPG